MTEGKLKEENLNFELATILTPKHFVSFHINGSKGKRKCSMSVIFVNIFPYV